MDNANHPKVEKFTLSLSNAAELASFALALGITFSIIRNYLYYVLYLHVPIFQYLSLSDVVLIAPSGIFWAIYYPSIDAANMVAKSLQFTLWQKLFFGLALYVFAGWLTWLGFHNEPIVEQALKIVFRHPWYIALIILYVCIMMHAQKSNNDFFNKNRYTAALILCIWYAAFDSHASYSVLTNSSRHIHIVMKMRNNSKIDIDNNVIYAGRTNDYWFLYDSKTKFVRVLKNEDIEVADFDTQTSHH